MRYPSMMPLLLLSFSGFAAHAHAANAGALPAWLAGHWCSQDEDSRSEELWLPSSGGLMLGLSRTVVAARPTAFEFLRIELVDGKLNYIAMPQGNPGTHFARTDAGRDWVRFENPAHDFPQRIEYRRSADALRATISGPGGNDGDVEMTFEFRRCDA